MKLADLLAGSKTNALNFFSPTVVANVEKRLADKDGRAVIRCLVRGKQFTARGNYPAALARISRSQLQTRLA